MTEARRPTSERLGDGLRQREGMTDALSLRVGAVLHRRPGLTIAEIQADLRANNYVATPEVVAAALDRSPSDFRCEEKGAAARWFAVLANRDLRDQEASTWSQPSVDAEAIRKITRVCGIDKLWHWSPAAAMRSILEHGLLARHELDLRGIRYEAHRYGSAAKEIALGAFVMTSLQPKPLMMFDRCQQPILWELDPEIATKEGTLFVRDNSAKAELNVNDILRSTGHKAYRIAIDTFTAGSGQVEILVPGAVPSAAIRTVTAYDAQAADAAEKWLGETATNVTLVRNASVLWRTGPEPLPF